MTGIVDVGGGMRGVYSSGLYDRLLDENVSIPYCLGVSAGSANLITYIAGQRGRTLEFYREYPRRKEYMSFGNFLKSGSYLGLDYIYSTLSNEGGENPLDFPSAMKSDIIFLATATRASDGKGVFFTKDDMRQNDYSILKASCCLPGVCKPVSLGDNLYFDGGIAEPIPIEKAFADGCDKVILVLTKPRKEYCEPMFATKVLASRIRKYPPVFSLMKTLHTRCSEIITKAEALEKEGKLLIIEPKDCFGMNTLTTDPEPIMKMYEQGYEDAGRVLEFIK